MNVTGTAKLEDELKCVGLIGFGTGYAWGKANIRQDENLDSAQGYCAKECAQQARCFAAHVASCRLMFPRSTKEFDRLCAEEKDQAKATARWAAEHPRTPYEPYKTKLIMNLEDGLNVGRTGKPVERGSVTLRWPR